jgi:hypothetical protein
MRHRRGISPRAGRQSAAGRQANPRRRVALFSTEDEKRADAGSKRIRMVVTEGVYRGVYALGGDRLVMCFAEEGRARPAALRPASGQWAERWQRGQPKGRRGR